MRSRPLGGEPKCAIGPRPSALLEASDQAEPRRREFLDRFASREIDVRSVPLHERRTHTAFGDLEEDHP